MKKEDVEKGYIIFFPKNASRPARAISVPTDYPVGEQLTKIVNLFSLMGGYVTYEALLLSDVLIATPGAVCSLMYLSTYVDDAGPLVMAHAKWRTSKEQAVLAELGKDTLLVVPALNITAKVQSVHDLIAELC